MENNIAAYYKEEEGFEVIQNEHGFCAYRLNTENSTCYIGHVFINEASRKKGHASKFLNTIERICVENKIKTIVGDLYLNPYNGKNYTKKVFVMLFNEFQIIDVNTGCITIMKEI